ncbi:MAG: hypothetical protein WBW93_16910 [Steroidobacteraceae bacterium]
MFFFRKSKNVGSTPLSDFVRNASASKKKKAYVVALKKASDAQNKIVRQAAVRKVRTA